MSNRFNDYREINAKFNSEGTCGHAIKKGDPIGWNRGQRKTQCKDCWRSWAAENAEADLYEANLDGYGY